MKLSNISLFICTSCLLAFLHVGAMDLSYIQNTHELSEHRYITKENSVANTALCAEAAAGNDVGCSFLLEGGANVNTRDAHGRTALALAALNGRVKACSLLLENRADATIPDAEGLTAVALAALNGHKEVYQLLLQRGAYINTDTFFESLSHLSQQKIDVIRLLLESVTKAPQRKLSSQESHPE